MDSKALLDLLAGGALQASVLAVVVWWIVRMFARDRPHFAHALWALVLLKCVTPPLWSIAIQSHISAPRKGQVNNIITLPRAHLATTPCSFRLAPYRWVVRIMNGSSEDFVPSAHFTRSVLP